MLSVSRSISYISFNDIAPLDHTPNTHENTQLGYEPLKIKIPVSKSTISLQKISTNPTSNHTFQQSLYYQWIIITNQIIPTHIHHPTTHYAHKIFILRTFSSMATLRTTISIQPQHQSQSYTYTLQLHINSYLWTPYTLILHTYIILKRTHTFSHLV